MEEVKEVVRNLASIQRIIALERIENADNLECCNVLGWKVVVKKGEFHVGDYCVYFEVDSILPKTSWSEFLVDKNRPDKPIRLKSICLRGQISQGLAIPLSALGEDFLQGISIEEGLDLTDKLGIVKYEPYISPELQGQVKGNFPSFLIKTDSHRLQAYPRLIEEMHGKSCYITIKVDGTSSTFYNRCDEHGYDDFGVCSRNMNLKESETNTYWKAARQYDVANILKGRNLSIQGEVFGPGIQKNRLGTDKVGLEVFDIFNIYEHRYYDLSEQVMFCSINNLPMVKIIYDGIFKWNYVDELIDFSNSQNYPNHSDKNDSPAEGIVIRSNPECYSNVLRGRMAFKVISNRYLLKYKE